MLKIDLAVSVLENIKRRGRISEIDELCIMPHLIKLCQDNEATMTVFDRSYIDQDNHLIDIGKYPVRRINTQFGVFWDLTGAPEVSAKIIYDDDTPDLQIPGAEDGLTLDIFLAACYGIERSGEQIKMEYEEICIFVDKSDWICDNDNRVTLATILMLGRNERTLLDYWEDFLAPQ